MNTSVVRSLLAAALPLAAASCQKQQQPAPHDIAPPNMLTDVERGAGWRLLFDG